MNIDDLLAYKPVEIPPSGRDQERTPDDRFVGVYQAADNWCWAAAAASVATFYDTTRDPNGPVHEQCRIVDDQGRDAVKACKEYPSRPCCGAFKDGADVAKLCNCATLESNRPDFLHRALHALGMLDFWVVLRSGQVRSFGGRRANAAAREEWERDMDIEAFDRHLRNNQLICLRTRRNGARHFIIVYGCETYPDQSLLIWDPANGVDVIEADRFAQEHGPFTHKIITRAPTTAAGPQ